MLKATNTYQITDDKIRLLLAHAIHRYEQNLSNGISKQSALENTLEEMTRPTNLAEYIKGL